MKKRVLRHKDRGCHDKVFCQLSCLRIGVVELGEERRKHKHQQCNTGTAEDGKRYHLSICIPGFLHLAGTQKLTYHNGYRISQGYKYDIKYIVDGIGNVQTRNYI